MYTLQSDDKNPDAGLVVSFYSRLLPQEFESEKQQRSISKSVDFVKILVPGNEHLTVDTIANDGHKARFPLHWAAYQNRGEAAAGVIGTPISDWPRITPEQADELRGLKFSTVEAIAHASDAHLHGIGMIAGQSAFTFRDDAKRFLAIALDNSKVKEAEDRAKKVEEESLRRDAENKAEMQALKDQMATLIAAMGEQKRGPGRPRQSEQEAA